MKAIKSFLRRLSRNPIVQRTGIIYKILFAVNFAAAQPIAFQSESAKNIKIQIMVRESKMNTTQFTKNFQTTNNTKKANND